VVSSAALAGGYRGGVRVAGLALAGVLVADLVGVVTLGSAPALTSVAATVRTASARTLSAHTARVAMSVGFSGGAPSMHTTFSEDLGGLVDFENHEMDLTGSTGPVAGLEARFVGGRLYEKLPPTLAAARHISTPWVSIPAPFGPTGSASPGTLTTGDPSATLTQLQNLSSGTITGATESGSEEVRGVPTTRYDLQLNIAAMNSLGTLYQAAQGLSGAPSTKINAAQIQVWIDSQGLIRRESFVMDATTSIPIAAGPLSFRATLSMEPYDFGVPVDVVPPPPDDVTDLPNAGALYGQPSSQ